VKLEYLFVYISWFSSYFVKVTEIIIRNRNWRRISSDETLYSDPQNIQPCVPWRREDVVLISELKLHTRENFRRKRKLLWSFNGEFPPCFKKVRPRRASHSKISSVTFTNRMTKWRTSNENIFNRQNSLFWFTERLYFSNRND